MKILAIDIGAGTQDILVYPELYKMVLPAPTKIFAEKVRRINGDLVIYGDTMGGGPFTRAIQEQLEHHRVYMTETAARTIKDDLSVVKRMGIDIIEEDEIDEIKGNKMRICDLDLHALLKDLSRHKIDANFDAIAIAVQDHGLARGKSDREYRFDVLRSRLNKSRRLEEFAYLNSVPSYLTRMQSLLDSVKQHYDGNIVLLDTGPAAILGSLEDVNTSKVVSLNIGNAHTIAMSLVGHEILGMFEHHTRLINEEKLAMLIRKMCDAKLDFDEIFRDNGHGAISIAPNEIESIVITGPNRELARNLGSYAVPLGDAMLSGPIGLVKATEYIFNQHGR